MAFDPALLWNLRLAAAEITDDQRRQLFLNALAETVRMVGSGKYLAPRDAAGRATPRPPVWDDAIAVDYAIGPTEGTLGRGRG